MIEGIIEKIEVVLEWISSIVLVSLLFIVWAQITFRYIFNNSLAWTEESARYLMIWGVLLGANLAFLKGYFISINLFVHRLPVKLQIALRVLRKLLALFFTGILSYYGVYLCKMGTRMQSPALGIEYVWVYISVPIGAALMFFLFLIRKV